jgi:uncharacterized protein involved in outer membrane biogenesis
MSRAHVVRRSLVAVATLVVLALLLQPWWLAALMSHRLSASAHRPVRFERMWVTLTAALQPVVHMSGVRIDNAPWADPGRPFAALESASAVFSWLSLRERRPVIALLVLHDGEVDLERRADGLRNWRLSQPEDRGPGRFKVLSIRGENAAVRFWHEGLDLDLEAKASADGVDAGRTDGAAPVSADGGAGGEALPTRLVIRGRWRGVPFLIDAATSEVLTFVETGRVFRARGQVTSGDARLDFDGQLGDIVRDPIVDARVALAAPSLAPFAPVLGPHRADVKGIVAAGEVKGSPGHYALSLAKGRVGASDLAGELSWTRGTERDLVSAKLSSESTSLEDLRALAGKRPAQKVERVGDAASTVAAAGDSPHARPTDKELSFAARRLHAEGMPWLKGGRIEATLADGVLKVSHFDIGIGEGRVTGKAAVDTQSEPLRGDAELDASAIQIQSLLPPRAEKSLLSGTLHGHAALKTSGDSPEALLANATGSVSAFISGGTISSMLDAKMGLQGGRVIRSMFTGAEPMALRCAAMVLDVARGAATVRSLVVDSERTRTLGSGTIDLRKQSIDLLLTPEAKQPGLFILDRSIHVLGPLREPRHELVARVAPASAPVRACRPDRP